MKPLFSAAIVATCLLALAHTPALAGNGGEPIYTWVDRNGVRHYSDHPASPQAKLLSPALHDGAIAAPPDASELSAPVSARPTASLIVAATAEKETPGERTARCTKLRSEVKRLQSARRVQVNEKGTTRYLSGEDLVAFKQKMRRELHSTCAAATSG